MQYEGNNGTTSLIVLSQGDSERPQLPCAQEPPPKKRRLSLRQQTRSSLEAPPIEKPSPDIYTHDHDIGQRKRNDSVKGMAEGRTGDESGIGLLAQSRHADQTVAPFLAQHIPNSYPPQGKPNSASAGVGDPSTKYCYRHRPDLKCRRQADNTSAEQLQNEFDKLSDGDKKGINHVWSVFSAAPSRHRNLILSGILMQCCFPQLSFLAANVRDLIKIDFLSALPSEIGFHVLSYLDTASLCNAAQVSQRWRTLADDDVVWHRMCEQHIDRKCTKCGWGLPLLDRKRLRTEKRQMQLRAIGKGMNEWSPQVTPATENPPPLGMATGTSVATADTSSSQENRQSVTPGPLSPSLQMKKQCLQDSREDASYFPQHPAQAQSRVRPWKDVYKDRFKVGTNWKYGRCCTKNLKGHTNGVMCLQLHDNIMATGSYDATIKIWDLETGKELRTLKGHESGIRCLQFDDTKLISGSIDMKLKVWDWRTGKCVSTQTGHTGGIISVHFDPAKPNLVATGSMDRTIKIWDFCERTCFKLQGHTDWVNQVKIDAASRTLLSASDDCTIRLWDLDSRTCIRIFEGHVGQVQQVLTLPHDSELDAHPSTENGQVRSPDEAEAAASITPLEFYGGLAANDPNRPLPPRYMLTGALDSTIRLWDTYSPPDPSPTAYSTSTTSVSSPPSPPTAPSSSCIRTFFGHVEGVWALVADSLRLVSGAEDRMIKIWDVRTGKCERTFTGHAAPVTCLGLSDSRLVSGSEDCEVRVLEFGADNEQETRLAGKVDGRGVYGRAQRAPTVDGEAPRSPVV